MNKKNDKTIYIIVITVLVALLLASLYYILYMNLDKIKKDKENTVIDNIPEVVDNNEEDDDLEEDDEDYYVNYAKININHKNYAGGYRAEVKEMFDEDNNEKYYVYMILRPDGTYTYGNNTVYGGRTVGTYKVQSNYIVLTEVVFYGSDVCFTKAKKNTEKKLKIIDKDTLEITDNGTKLRFKYNKSVKEDEFENAWYILNPKDGESPKGIKTEEAWDDCSD